MNTEFNEQGELCLVSVTKPDFIEVRDLGWGYGLFTKKLILKDEVIDVTDCIRVPEGKIAKKLTLRINEEEYQIDGEVHTSDSEFVYGWDSLINHHCEGNTRTKVTETSENIVTYMTIAKKQINEGEQLSVNYNEFYYEHPEFKCCCDSPHCICFVRGFRYLDDATRTKMLEIMDPFDKELILEKGEKEAKSN